MTTSFSASAAVSAPMNVPNTQNTAPVLEFRCLFTQDLRRKQKRWSDGRLRFHTFNSRIMVFDERSNVVGDTFWPADADFAEGEELELERSGTLVEVGECVGKRDQDLTELVDKRVKEREGRAAAKAATPAPSFRNPGTPISNILRPKPLNALVTPTGHYGRALVPGTTPFEARQATLVQERNEQERPAKRRKPNELTSSKSGYAQNLMGATLSLASSRPPSTAPIRYEPVRVTPSIPARAAMIDLTLEGSGDSDQQHAASRVGMKERVKPSKTHRMTRNSPPPKSGYASNLTGAALTLSRPDSSRPNRPSNFSAPQPLSLNKSGLHESSSEGEEDFPMIVPPKRLSAKETSGILERQKPSKGRSPELANSSSPPRPAKVQKAPTMEKRASGPQSAMQKSSGIEQTPDRPMSALRIKGRSAPKMMMLMDRPSSRVMSLNGSSAPARKKPTPIQKVAKTSNNIMLSQATMELDAFCQKQEEKRQARLRGERRTAIVDIDDISSSSADTDIDHQTIDHLLSRRKSSEKVMTLSSDLSQSSYRAEMATGQETIQLAPERSDEIALPSSNSHMSSPHIESRVSIPPPEALGSRSYMPNSPVAEASQEHRMPSLISSVHEDHDSSPEGDCEPLPEKFQATRTEMPMSGPEPSGLKRSKVKAFPDHVTNDMQAAREHFRTILKSSSSQQHEMAALPPCPPNPEPEQTPKIMPVPRMQEINSVGPSKADSESIQPARASVVEEHGVQNATPVTAGGMPASVVEPAEVQSIPPARRVLMNPATRGKSVQTLAANTVDTLNNPSTVMAPPPVPRVSSRTETINGLSDVARGGRREPVREVSDGGPWSREAFDLFDNKTCERIMTLRAGSTATG